MPSVVTSSNFKIEDIKFGKHKPNVNGGYNIEISIGESMGETLIQTPKMRAPFGISTDKTNPFKKSLDVSFQGIEISTGIKSFRELIDNVDKMVINYAVDNCKTFFKKELSREIISDYYYSGMKISKKEQYSDTFRFKLLFLKPDPEKNRPDGKYLTSFWSPGTKGNEGQEQQFSYLDKGDYVVGLIKPQMLWVANRSFGVTWVCTQLRVHKQVKASGYAFKKVESESDEDADDSDNELEEVEVDDSDNEHVESD